MMIKAVIFDWGGVLIENPADGLIEHCARSLGTDPKALRGVFSRYEARFQRGEIGEDRLWKEICAELGVETPKAGSLWKEAVRSVFKDKPETFALAKSLREAGYKVGFLSNTEMPAMEHFAERGYAQYFDAATFSCAEGTAKPEERIYRIALERLGVAPHETVFIDDKPPYVEGAEKIEMRGIVYRSFGQVVEDLAALSVR